MYKKIGLSAFLLILIISLFIAIVTSVLANDYIAYNSAQEYKDALIESIENDDLEQSSNLIFSIANNKYYEELNDDILEYKKNMDADSQIAGKEALYNGYISLLEYINIKETSTFEIVQIDKYNLMNEGIVFFKYSLDGVQGYYVNAPLIYNFNQFSVASKLNKYESEKTCIESGEKQEFCENRMYVKLNENMYINYDEELYIPAYIDYTYISEGTVTYKSEETIDYVSSADFDDYLEIATDLNTIMDSNTSEEKREELQLKILKLASDNGQLSYSYINEDGTLNEDFVNNDGVNYYINMLCEAINDNMDGSYGMDNEDDILYIFVDNYYYNMNDEFKMNAFLKDYDMYSYMFDKIDTFIF